MEIRLACERDIPRILTLLDQIAQLHALGRPDLFHGERKFGHEDVMQMLADPNKPVYVATEGEYVLGYAMCVYKEYKNHPTLLDRKVMYIDDLCVDEVCRGQGIGKKLYDHVYRLACDAFCVNVELNVWAFNAPALRFYEKCGMKPQRIIMESEKLQNSH